MKTVRILWKEFNKGEEPICGHGIEFHVGKLNGKHQLIAFIDGFEWYHGCSDEMKVWMRSDSDVMFAKAITTIRKAIQTAATSRDIVHGELSDDVIAWVNG